MFRRSTIDNTANSKADGRIRRYVGCLNRGGAYAVFLFWVLVCGAGVFVAPEFLSSLTDSTDDLPADSPGLKAYARLNELQPWKGFTSYLTVVVRPKAGGDAFASNATKEFATAYQHMIYRMAEDPAWRQQFTPVRIETPWNTTQVLWPDLFGDLSNTAQWPDFAVKNATGQSVWVGVAEACPAVGGNGNGDGEVQACSYRTPTPAAYLAAGNGSAILVLRCIWIWPFWNRWDELFGPLAERYAAVLEVDFTSEGAIDTTIPDELQADLFKGDAISIPIAVLLLCFTLRSARYAFIPVLSILGSTLGAILIMQPIAKASTVSEFSPNMIMVLSISLAVDYNLFFLSRWREEIGQTNQVEQAVTNVILHAGHTIFVSGITLLLCCLTLWLIPLDLLSSLGTSASAAVATSIAINLTVTPSLILVFPRYFTRAASRSDGTWCVRKHGNRKNDRNSVSSNPAPQASMNDVDADRGSGDDVVLISTDLGIDHGGGGGGASPSTTVTYVVESASVRRRHSKKSASQSQWYRFGKTITTGWWPYLWTGLIVGVCGLMVMPAISFTPTGGPLALGPSNVKPMIAWKKMAKEYGYGRLITPYQLVAVCPERAGHNSSRLAGIAMEELKAVYDGRVQYLLDPEAPCCGGDTAAACHFGQLAWDRQYGVGFTGLTTAVVEFGLDVDEWGSAGTRWLHDVRDHFKALPANYPGCTFDVALGAAIDIDIVDTVYKAVPVCAGAVAGLVFVLMTVAFRSLILSAKAVVTILITLSLVYGSAKLVYEDGIFGDGFRGTAPTGGLTYIPPVLVFPLLVGFGLDYHIFLLSRVLEYRLLGNTDSESVLLGLSKTGRVITFAGLIMATAFAGLLFAHESILSQMGFIVIVAVLIDTFIVRAVLVPSMMAMLGKYNWWPRRMPPPRSNGTEEGHL